MVVLDIGGAAAHEIGEHTATRGTGSIRPAAVPQVGIENDYRASPAAQDDLVRGTRQTVFEDVLRQFSATVRARNDPCAAVFFGVIVYQPDRIANEVVPGGDCFAPVGVQSLLALSVWQSGPAGE